MQTQHRYRALWGLAAGLALAVFGANPLAAQQTGTVEGTVVDGTQSPIVGAQVSIVGTQRGTITDADGSFRIANVQPGDRQVRASRIGYGSQTQTVQVVAGQTATVSLSLTETAIALDQVIVTGTAGRQDRRAQSASVGTIDAAGLNEVAPISTVANLLQARTPGVSLTQASGTAGGGQRIRLRGQASISLSNDPIVIVDGVRVDSRTEQIYGVGGQATSRLNDINPDDIESIEIVRGPAAATLYGSDASAGVIQIRTKRGAMGAGFQQTVRAEYGHIDGNITVPDNFGICSAAMVTDERRALCFGQEPGTVVRDNPLARYDAFRDGQSRLLGWTGRGGGETFGYYFSFSGEDEQGTLPSNEYIRYSGRANFDFTPTDNFRVEAGMGVGRTRIRMPDNDNNIYGYLGGALLGSPLSVGGFANDGWYAPNRQVEAISNIANFNTTIRNNPRISLVYTPIDWFSNRLTVGADLLRTEASNFFPRNDEGWYGTATLNSGQIQQARRGRDEITVDYLGNVSTQLTDGLSSDFALGFQYVSTRNDLTFATGQGLATNEARAISAAAQTTGGQSFSEFKQFGGLAQWDLGWQNRLFLQIGGRLDSNSTFGREADAFLSPRVGVSYVISEEAFWQNNPTLTSLFTTMRLRGAWGTSGNSPGSTSALEIFTPAPYALTPTAVRAGVIPQQPGAPDLRPERGTELELGFETGLFNDRIGLEVNYFNKTSTDVALRQPTPPSLGFTQDVWVNIGEMVNRGFEVGIDGRLVDTPNFGWDARLGFNTLHNEVTDLGTIEPIGSFTRVVPGYQVNSIWTHRIREYVTDPARAAEVCPGANTSCAIVSDTTEFWGNSIPTFEGNFSSTITFLRNFRLYGQLDWMNDFIVYNNTNQFRERQFGTGENWVLRDEVLTDEERIQRFGPFVSEDGRTIGAANVTEAYDEDASFVKLRELSLGYTVPRAFANRLGIQGATITVAGRNLATWTNYSGADPEVLWGGGAVTSTTRTEFLTLPPTRRIVLQTSLQF
jgi:TonB-dependent starch-binding outer membrane protein SusC